MQLLHDPQVWLSFLTLAFLEIILGIDNIIFLTVLVDRLPAGRRRTARLLGLSFAMVTRIALLYSVTWIAGLTATLFTVMRNEISGRDLVLFGGGAFLVLKSIGEIRDTVRGTVHKRKPGKAQSLWLIILQIGVIDIVFSLDSVFTAVGLSRHFVVMAAAIIASVVVMMAVSSAISRFIGRYPSLKVLALAFLVLVGGALIAEALDINVPQGYMYFAMAFAVAVEWINIQLRKRRP